MAIPGTISNDGSVKYGVATVTIESQAFKATNMTINQASQSITVKDGVGTPYAHAIVPQLPTGSGTLNWPTGTTPRFPNIGDSFTYTFNSTDGARTLRIESVGETHSNGADTTINITFADVTGFSS